MREILVQVDVPRSAWVEDYIGKVKGDFSASLVGRLESMDVTNYLIKNGYIDPGDNVVVNFEPNAKLKPDSPIRPVKISDAKLSECGKILEVNEVPTSELIIRPFYKKRN